MTDLERGNERRRLSVAEVYARFMVVFFFAVGIPAIIRPLTDAPSGGFILWPEAARVFGIFLGNWFHFVVHCLLGGLGIFLMFRTDTAREFARLIFVVVAMFLAIGVTTNSGVWLVPASWPGDAANGQIAVLAKPSWYGYIPLNAPDNALHALVATAAFLVGFTRVGLRPWGFWRKDGASQGRPKPSEQQ